jgi:hypothetical protein
MKIPVILARKSNSKKDLEEMKEASKYFKIFYNRASVPKDSLVIGRMSVVPFYFELQEDLKFNNSMLINNSNQHQFLSDIGNWSEKLKEFTPKTYRNLYELPQNGPFVLKGENNSKKNFWETHMFAKTREEAVTVFGRLSDDYFFSDQKIYAREFVDLKCLLKPEQGPPVSKEFRFFIFNKKVVCSSFYWDNFVDDLNKIPSPEEVPVSFVKKIIDCVGEDAMFYTADVAQKENGEWILIELNDGQMSGLCCNSSEDLYSGILKTLEKQNED